jgi:hypothetical protein
MPPSAGFPDFSITAILHRGHHRFPEVSSEVFESVVGKTGQARVIHDKAN